MLSLRVYAAFALEKAPASAESYLYLRPFVVGETFGYYGLFYDYEIQPYSLYSKQVTPIPRPTCLSREFHAYVD